MFVRIVHVVPVLSGDHFPASQWQLFTKISSQNGMEVPLKSMPRAELIPEKPTPEKIKVVQQNLQHSFFSFSDEIIPPE
jgi:hypothetical protein